MAARRHFENRRGEGPGNEIEVLTAARTAGAAVVCKEGGVILADSS